MSFSIPGGHYEWNAMPFGLKHAPSKFPEDNGSDF